ncbi:C1 family peptidase [Lewinella sp. 4G2]|uniref:C1 family peptidase n=1 Tax=Lewinella sp. 4G2 TaxID=1803372 RepID=UPI0007B4706C|nr:C1 family peptidase [Lewinella sp. 4G2]OAV46073.1 hypothetical protein A3850_017570 [Lewinella sp. 4G2]
MFKKIPRNLLVASLLFLAGPFLPTLLAPALSAQRPNASAPTPVTTARSNQMMVGIEDAQTIDAMMYNVEGIGSGGREELARQNVKSYMMPIRQVANSNQEWAYALTSSLEYYKNLSENFKENYSPDYLMMSLANQGTRPNIEDGLRFLVEQGTVSANIVPYGSNVIPGAVYSVPKIRVTNFFYLFRETTRNRNRIFEIKKALSRGNPVLVELRTPPGFERHATATYQPAGAATETHYLNVVGYNSLDETVELRGNFGRLWADAGYVTMSYDDFSAIAVQGFVLHP